MLERFRAARTASSRLPLSAEGWCASDADTRDLEVGPHAAHQPDGRRQRRAATEDVHGAPPTPEGRGTCTGETPPPTVDPPGGDEAEARPWIWPWVWPLAYLPFRLLFAATLAAALGCGLMAGFFFAFSFTLMDALARLPPEQGIAAMQVITVVVLNPWFRVAYFGTALVCVVLAASSLFRRHEPGAAYLLVGGLLYLVGTILVTILFNVPRNNALAAVDPTSAEAASFWADYLTTWTAWNHVRTAAALTAAALLTIALCQQRVGTT